MTTLTETPPALLSDDEVIRLALALRAAFKALEPEHRKSRVLEILESAVVASLISVVLGGWIGNLLIAHYQERLKEHEEQILTYKEHEAARQAAIVEALGVLGDVEYNSSALISLTQPYMQPENVAPGDRKALQALRNELASSARAFKSSWEKRQLVAGLKLQLYCPELAATWKAASSAANSVLSKSDEQYENYINDPAAFQEVELADVNRAFASALDTFSATLGDASQQKNGS